MIELVGFLVLVVLIFFTVAIFEARDAKEWKAAWQELHLRRIQLEAEVKKLQDRLDRINDITCEEVDKP